VIGRRNDGGFASTSSPERRQWRARTVRCVPGGSSLDGTVATILRSSVTVCAGSAISTWASDVRRRNVSEPASSCIVTNPGAKTGLRRRSSTAYRRARQSLLLKGALRRSASPSLGRSRDTNERPGSRLSERRDGLCPVDAGGTPDVPPTEREDDHPDNGETDAEQLTPGKPEDHTRNRVEPRMDVSTISPLSINIANGRVGCISNRRACRRKPLTAAYCREGCVKS